MTISQFLKHAAAIGMAIALNSQASEVPDDETRTPLQKDVKACFHAYALGYRSGIIEKDRGDSHEKPLLRFNGVECYSGPDNIIPAESYLCKFNVIVAESEWDVIVMPQSINYPQLTDKAFDAAAARIDNDGSGDLIQFQRSANKLTVVSAETKSGASAAPKPNLDLKTVNKLPGLQAISDTIGDVYTYCFDTTVSNNMGPKRTLPAVNDFAVSFGTALG